MLAMGGFSCIMCLLLSLSHVSEVHSMGGNWGGNGNGDGDGDNGGQPQLPPPQPTIFERRADLHALANQDPCKARQVRTNQMSLAIANQACAAAYNHFMALTVTELESCPEAEDPQCRSLPYHHNWRCTFSCNVPRHSGSSTPSPRVPRRQSALARLFSCASGSSRRRREPDRVARSTSRGSRRERVLLPLEEIIRTVHSPPPPLTNAGPTNARRRVVAGAPPGYQ